MEFLFSTILFMAIAFVAGYGAGCAIEREPSEEEMMRRLVNMRVARKLHAVTKADIDREIDVAAERIVDRT